MGLVICAILLPVTLSFAVLIYSGDLQPYAGIGIGSLLLGAVVMQVVIALGSGTRGMIGGPQDSPAAILATSAAGIGILMAGAAPETKLATILAVIILSTLSVGVTFILIGAFRASRFVRYIPYPVVGGFIAGTGLLLVQGALGVLLNDSIGMSSLWKLMEPGQFINWVPGTLFGIALVLASRKSSHILTIPVMLIFAAALFHGYLFLSGASIADARQMGWLLGPFPEGSLWKPLDLSLLREADWGVIRAQVSNIAAVVMISVIAMLLNVSAVELISREDVDLNRELISTGAANLAGAFGGSSAGYHYLSMIAIPMRAGVKSRLVGVFSALMIAVVVLFGAQALSFVPTLIVGGLLLFIGLSFLVEWVYDAWRNLPKLDYALVIMILVVVGWAGYLPGVGAGILAAVILFAVNYSRIDVVKDALTGQTYQSNVERPEGHRTILYQKGLHVHILRLEGYIFFGTAQGLLGRIRERIGDKALPKLRFLILDFKRVSALDSSAIFGFLRIQQLAKTHDFQIFLTELSAQIRETLGAGGMVFGTDSLTRAAATNDEAMEICENALLNEDENSMLIRAATLQAQLKRIFETDENVEIFKSYLERLEADQFHILIRQGDDADAMYVVEAGQLTARFEADGRFLRLRSMGPGAFIGEIGLYLNHKRTATVVVDQKSVLYKLTRESLKRMEEERPAAATRLHRWIVLTLSQRLGDNNRTLEALLR